MRDTYTVTTPIYYATDEPHIGHAYTTVAADVTARFQRLLGRDVFFLTGTDEHGQKMESAAAKLGISPRELADRTAPRYEDLWRRLNISYNHFIRTTDKAHAAAVTDMWRRMAASGDIYKGAYEGPYCVACESFYLEKELKDGLCPDHGTKPELLKEEGYFFKLSAYGDKLLEHYERNPSFIQPETRRNEVLSFVKGGLKDLSVSRATIKWGIPVPGDPAHVIYVWVDALTNYLSGLGYPSDGAKLTRYWPAQVQLVGKDILRFHAVYWPAFLMSAGLELPQQIYSHGWWLRGGEKISKSKGGVVKVEPLIDGFGADAVRYFLLREVPFGLDGVYSDESFLIRYNADLANDYGNLVSRTVKLLQQKCEATVPPRSEAFPGLKEVAERALTGYRKSFEHLAYSRGLDALWELVREANRYLDRSAPWKLGGQGELGREELNNVMWNLAETCRIVAVALEPVMPTASARVLDIFGEGGSPRTVDALEWGRLPMDRRLRVPTDAKVDALFPRKDATAFPAKEEAPAEAAPTGPLITYDDFMKVALKTATVKLAEAVPKSRKLIRLIVDLGGEERQIVAGIGESYKPEELVGRTIVVVANLAPAKLMGVESRGMLLAASVDGKPILVGFDREVGPGSQVK